MFDGLKEKLGRFSEDVEEDVDEEAIEAAEESAAEPETESPAEPDQEDSADVGEADDGEPQPEEPSGQAEADTPVDDTTTEQAEPEATDEAEDSGGSFLSRLTGSSGSSESPEAAEAETDEQSVEKTETDVPPSDVDEEPETDELAAEPSSDVDEEPETDESAAAEGEGNSDRGLAERAKLFATGKTVIDEDDLQDHLDQLELALLSSDVEMSVAQEILDGVKANLTGQTRRRLESTGNLVQDALREALYDVISVGQFDFDQRIAEAEKPITVIFTGVNGVGKTTSIAKLSQYLEDRGYSSVVANGDTYRAGANEQLEQHARNLDTKCISHDQGSDPTAVIYDAVEYAQANDVDVVLGDTAGRLHTSNDLMAQLEKIDRVIEPDMTIFVDEAVAGQDAVNRAREFDEAAEIDGAILTKADADSQGGAAISVAYVTGKPILFLGTGQDYDDLERFDPEVIVDQLFEE